MFPYLNKQSVTVSLLHIRISNSDSGDGIQKKTFHIFFLIYYTFFKNIVPKKEIQWLFHKNK